MSNRLRASASAFTSPPEFGTACNPTHVLCVDDDDGMAGVIESELTRRGYRVTAAHGGQAGLAGIVRLTPDIVLSAVRMPGFSGLDVLAALIALSPRAAAMPFIFLMDIADRETELRCRRSGADDVVARPVDFEMLVAIIESRLAGVARRRLLPEIVGLNAREAEVLTWAARGKTSAEIALIVNLTRRTVDFHADKARAKLNACTRMQAAAKAACCGLIDI